VKPSPVTDSTAAQPNPQANPRSLASPTEGGLSLLAGVNTAADADSITKSLGGAALDGPGRARSHGGSLWTDVGSRRGRLVIGRIVPVWSAGISQRIPTGMSGHGRSKNRGSKGVPAQDLGR
jgi:hypothetical protein